MNRYEASNGVVIEFKEDPDGKRYLLGTVQRTCGELSGTLTHATGSEEGVDALREFFQAESDERLGRWRWPENPEYVVYPSGIAVRVLHERTGVQTYPVHRDAIAGSQPARAGLAYFDAHPSKAWRDAKPGEVWLLTIDGDETPAIRDVDEDFFSTKTSYRVIRWNSDRITAGRRIWPEPTDA